uniref:Uncharacterized protein n=1 Tax=Acrobeloides nanus TaxID=290746 RepID=A0A914D2T2_9BILA
MNIHAALPRIPKSRGKKNRPGDTGWKQQTLSAYRPLLTFRCALPIVVVLSVVLIAGGILLYESALSAQEGVIDYTKCLNFNGSQQPWSVDPNMPPHPYLPPIPPNPLKYELLDKDEGNLGNEEGNNTCIYNLHLNQSFTVYLI